MTAFDIVVCTHTTRRLEQLEECVAACRAQMTGADRLLLVVDGDESLAAVVEERIGGEVLRNRRTRGLAGARNTGIEAGSNDVVAFVDDDAVPRSGWLDALRRRFEGAEVDIVGGRVVPNWEGGAAPAWFPEEFGWVIGCDYTGIGPDGATIRNPIGANMAIRRRVFETAGEFDEEFGRRGSGYAGCEETELAIRAAAAIPGLRAVRDEAAAVDHLVPVDRQRVGYLVRRCYHEGRSKAQLTHAAGARNGLSAETRHATSTLPRSWWAALRDDAPLGPSLGRVALSIGGLAAAAVGLAAGRLEVGRTSP